MNIVQIITFLAVLIVAVAYDDISRYKSATQSHTAAGTNQYAASNAVDGDLATCMRTKEIGTASPDKTVWWKVDFGGVFNIYRINILFKEYDKSVENRQIGRFAGFSLFVSNTSDIQSATQCYKDGPQLPALNFTSICTERGRYVIFYNERLDRVSYPTGYEVTNVITELCEVTVQGCDNTSVYGINCNTPCPTNCKDNTCNIQSGACFNCKPGWTNMYCNTKCKEGWYGLNCTQQCVGHCKDGITCNHVTGHCDGGCDAGWTGFMCDKGCDDGTFGYNCTNTCSGHCLYNSPCNKQTGHCDRGCDPGYTYNDCNKVCSPGHYGVYCKGRCSGHCLNNEPCDHVSGACSRGCLNGFVGTYCNSACSKGYFGTNCSRKCSPYCRPDRCRHTDGYCTTCTAGWMGHNCTTECVQSYGENCRNSCSSHCYNQTCERFNGQCLLGCNDGFYGEQCERGRSDKMIKQNVSSCINLIIGLSISILINLIVVGCGILLCRKRKPSSVTNTGSVLFCLKESVYQDTFVKAEEASTYQELDLPDSAYQNTRIQ